MVEFSKGVVLSLVVNLLTVVGWLYIGVWPPWLLGIGTLLQLSNG